MFSRWWLLILAPLALAWAFNFALRWIVAPILMKRKQRIKARPAWEPTELEQLTPEMQDFMGRTIGRFREIGFEVALNARTPDLVSSVVGYQLLLINRSTQDVATTVIARAATTRSMAIFIQSIFRDGSRMVTASRAHAGIHPSDPKKDVANFPWVSDPVTLWAAHLRRLESTGRLSVPRVAPQRGMEEQFVREQEESEMTRMVACGYRKYNEVSDEYLLTWKGAFLSTWKLTQPVKRWRLRAQDRASRRLWESLGMGPAESGAAESTAAAPEASPLQSVATAPGLPPAPLADATLSYAAPVAPGQVHRFESGGTLTLRIGSPSVGQVLGQRWWTLAFAAFALAMLGWTLYRLWLFSRIVRVLPPRFYSLHLKQVYRALLIWVALLAFDGWQIARALSRARGTTVLTADHSGPRYSNIAGRPRAGFVPRDDFQSFGVVLDRLGFTGRTYRFEVRTQSSHRPIVLTVGGAAATYNAAGIELTEAMGIDAPRSVPLPLPV